MMISMSSLSWSHHRNKIPKLLTIYFKSCGLAMKAFDTLHALGIAMSQKWAYDAIDQLSKKVHEDMLADINNFCWFGTHDNINLPSKVYKQRLNNQTHFDSGTAATIVIIKDPAAAYMRPDYSTFQRQCAIGAKNPICCKDILKLERDATPRLRERAIFRVLSFLLDSTSFDFQTYSHRNDECLKAPCPCHQLPVGPEYKTTQYMLNTVHIEEASYEGNDHVLEEWWRQLGFRSEEKLQELGTKWVLVWVGDQLTVARLRGLQKFHCMDLNLFDRLSFMKTVFGWFHTQIALESSLHSQYYGSHGSFGLQHAFDLLKRKGLHAPSVQGDFHYHFQDGLNHIAEAHF